MLAGRKLLLADDSITIQKVVALTFADEGVEVVSVSNGRDAIDRLAEFLPDVVLADAFMPQMNGYEVCEYIKQNEKLKHIPVMLLVGSFEPYDEAEARRVGADDTLTKPFQSIRNLIDKVGALVSGRPTEEQIPTAELPRPDAVEPEPETLSEAEIEIVTADTQPLPAELRHMIEESASRAAATAAAEVATTTAGNDGSRATPVTENRNAGTQRRGDADDVGDTLLDLGGFEPGRQGTDDFVLDIDLDEVPDAASDQPSAYVRAPVYKSSGGDWKTSRAGSERQVASVEQLTRTQEFPSSISEAATAYERQTPAGAAEAKATEPRAVDLGSQAAAPVSLETLPPEVIEAIARRAVEQLSEKVVREIAWEVVPDLAELLIKRQLEEKST